MDRNVHLNHDPVTPEDLEHLLSCEFCLEQFADRIEAGQMLTAPRNMKAAILERSQKPDVQVIAKSNHASKRLQLFYYSLKVSFAAACALGLLIWSPQLPIIQRTPPTFIEEDFSFSDQFFQHTRNFSDTINKLSNKLFQSEVTFYDEQEK